MEILVHIAAPSSRRDDLGRSKQAELYPSFECARRHDVRIMQHGDGTVIRNFQDLQPGNVTNGVVRDTQLAISALESQLVSPVASKPTTRRMTRSRALEQPTSQALLYQESFTSSSSLDARKGRPASQRPVPSPERVSDINSPAVHRASPLGAIVPASVNSRWSESDDVPDQLPSTYSVSDGTSDPRTPAKQPATTDVPPKEIGDQSRARPGTETVPVASSVPARQVETTIDPETVAALACAPRILQPAPPPTSAEPFVSHVTSTLETLITNPSLLPRYAPSNVSRELRTSERGYWSFDTSPWTPQAQLAFWDFMANIISNGSAGWGVWCARESDSSSLGEVHTFCWGQVVPHVYLLLYVASKSRIKRLACRWIDADGLPVVQM